MSEEELNRDVLRLISYFMIFLLGALLGSAFPSYSFQYQQGLKEQLYQLRVDLAPFQEIANQFHDGNRAALVEHHLKSDNQTFHAEGAAIQFMREHRTALATADTPLNEYPFSQAMFFVDNIDYEFARSTWQSYKPSILTTPEAFRFSVIVGAGLTLLSYLLWGSRLFTRRV